MLILQTRTHLCSSSVPAPRSLTTHVFLCCSRTNDRLDAYVLSESSLFVYSSKWVLKTCGTTKLLHSLPRLLEMVAALGMQPRRCKYSRATYLFPNQQVTT